MVLSIILQKKFTVKIAIQKKHKNGTTTFFHTAITPVIVAPGNNQMISLPPKFITPQDGNSKQDCANAAAKHWLAEFDHHSGY